MRGKIRQWFVDSPRAMTAAYALVLAGTYAGELLVSTQEATGGTTGP